MTEIEYVVNLNDAESLWLLTKMEWLVMGLSEGWADADDDHRAYVEMAALKILGVPSLFGERIWCTVKIVIEKTHDPMELEQEEEAEG